MSPDQGPSRDRTRAGASTDGPTSSGRRWLGLVGFLVASFAAAGIAVALQGGDVQSFYVEQLQRPPWAPPPWVFGPVWTVLYALIAVAAWRVWTRAGWTAALTVWVAQLVFNAAWTRRSSTCRPSRSRSRSSSYCWC